MPPSATIWLPSCVASWSWCRAPPEFDHDAFIAGEMTPVFFGTALGNFGVDHMLDGLTDWAPAPMPRKAESREVVATEEKFSGFVFKIQANMDPKHRDRIAFMRIVSGTYSKGMKMRHVRIGKDVNISDAVTFMAGDREQAVEACAGDIIGLHNHGTIQIGDTFTQGEDLKFTGIPNFAPELFRRIRLRDPLKQKQLLRGWCSSPKRGGAGVPSAHQQRSHRRCGRCAAVRRGGSRLKSEYNVEAIYEAVNVATARWVEGTDVKKFEEFKRKNEVNLALDGVTTSPTSRRPWSTCAWPRSVTRTFTSARPANTDHPARTQRVADDQRDPASAGFLLWGVSLEGAAIPIRGLMNE